MHSATSRRRPARGYSLLELMIVLVVLTIGVLALAKLFPAASREQVRDRLRTAASYYAQEKMETLRALSSLDTDLADGRHPSDTTNESVGTSGVMDRYWNVSHLPDPLANVTRVDVVVRWTSTKGLDSTMSSSYLNR